MLGGRCPVKTRNVAKKDETPLCKKLTAILRDKTKRKNERLAKKEARLAKVTRSKCPKGERKAGTECRRFSAIQRSKEARKATRKVTRSSKSPQYPSPNSFDKMKLIMKGDKDYNKKFGLHMYHIDKHGHVYDTTGHYVGK